MFYFPYTEIARDLLSLASNNLRLSMMNTLKLEDKDKQTTTIVKEDSRIIVRTPKTNSTRKGSRSCTSCVNTGGKYEQIDSIVAHEVVASYYRVVKCTVNVEGVVHLSLVSSQHDNRLVSFEGSALNLSIEDTKEFVDDLHARAGECTANALGLRSITWYSHSSRKEAQGARQSSRRSGQGCAVLQRESVPDPASSGMHHRSAEWVLVLLCSENISQ